VTEDRLRVEDRLQKLKAGVISGVHKDLALVRKTGQNLNPTITDLCRAATHLDLMTTLLQGQLELGE
jgi:hypothetical protein